MLELPQRPEHEPSRQVASVRRRPTRAETAELAAAYETGVTIQQLAGRFGLHRETVSAALERSGVARRYHQRRTVDLDQADELHAAGLTICEVAEAMGIGRTTLIVARRQARS